MHVYHQYVLHSKQINKIKDALANNDIQSRTYYPVPLNKYKPYYSDQHIENSTFAGQQGLAIPVHQYLTNDEVKLIIRTIREAI